MIIALASWGDWESSVHLFNTGETDDKGNYKLKITGLCRGSVKPDPNGFKNGYVLAAPCQEADGPPPAATGKPLLVEEWYSDLPWHQKLSTKDSNLIDTPFVLPFEALSFEEIDEDCKTATDADEMEKSRCMLRYGVVNVIGMHRTDTLYEKGEALLNEYCKNDDCVDRANLFYV